MWVLEVVSRDASQLTKWTVVDANTTLTPNVERIYSPANMTDYGPRT